MSRAVPCPEPREMYTRYIKPDVEENLRLLITAKTTYLGAIDAGNVQNWLLTIGQTAQFLQNLGVPSWPVSLLTDEGLQVYAETHGEQLVNLLQAVRDKQAYAWLCEEIGTRPLLRNCLVPGPDHTGLSFILPPFKYRQLGSQSKTTKTTPMNTDGTIRPHLPIVVLEDEHLPTKMIRKLQHLLKDVDKEVSTSLSSVWSDILVKHSIGRLSDEADSTVHSQRILEFCAISVYPVLIGQEGPTLNVKQQRVNEHSRPRILMDIVVEDITQLEPISCLLWENKSTTVFDQHAPKILALGQTAFSFDSTSQRNYENEKAIIGKLVYHAMDSDFPPKWAIVFGGNEYMVFSIIKVVFDGEIRPVITTSHILSITDKDRPLIALVTYMLLTKYESDQYMFDSMELKLPEGTCPASSDHPPDTVNPPAKPSDKNEDNDSNNDMDVDNIDTAQYLEVRFAQPGILPFTMSRVGSLEEPNSLTGATQIPSLLLHFLGHGGFGSVYRSSARFVFKMAHMGTEDILRAEKQTYDVLCDKKIEQIPSCYGLFEHDGSLALVLSYEGASLENFNQLSQNDRRVLFNCLQQIHDAGIIHGDFEPRNVLSGASGPIIIDFSSSSVGHSCGGMSSCEELQRAFRQLRLDTPEDRSPSVTPTPHPILRLLPPSKSRPTPHRQLPTYKQPILLTALGMLTLLVAYWTTNSITQITLKHWRDTICVEGQCSQTNDSNFREDQTFRQMR